MVKQMILIAAFLPLATWGETIANTEEKTNSDMNLTSMVHPNKDYPPESIVKEYEDNEDNFDKEYDLDDTSTHATSHKRRFFSWNTHWFAEVGSGITMTTAGNTGRGSALGNETSMTLGCWTSPLIGMRLTVTNASTKWKQYKLMLGEEQSCFGKFNTYNLGGKFEVLFNPLALDNGKKWDDDYGLSVALGAGYGTVRRYDVAEEFVSTGCTSLNAGVHIWKKIGDDLQFFVEPHYIYNIYSKGSNAGGSNFGVNLGVTMNLHSPLYRCPDRCKNFKDDDESLEGEERPILFCRGFDFGMGGGLVTLQRRSIDYGGDGMNWNFSVFGEYHLSNIFSLRTNLDFTHVSSNNAYAFTSAPDQWGMWQVNTQHLYLSVSPEWNITTIFGRCKEDDDRTQYSRGPKFEMAAFIGPTLDIRTAQDIDPISMEAVGHSPILEKDKKLAIGVNGGVKLTQRLFAGLSVFFTPTWYFFLEDRNNVSANTVSLGKVHMYQTYTVGLQYRLDKLRVNWASIKKIMVRHGSGKQDLSRVEKKRLRNIIKRHRQ